MQKFPELGIYTLPGRVNDPQRVLDEVPLAEQLGIGSVWVGERYDYKHAATICGAAAAVTSHIKIATGLVNYPTHHPMDLASLGTTLNEMSGGRFAMGIGRGFKSLYDCFGTSNSSLAGLEHLSEILRAVWSGAYSGEGPVGNFPYLFMAEPPPQRPPLLLGTMGRKTLALAGRCYDGVLLHPFLTDEVVAEHTKIVRDAAEHAGRDPQSVKVWSTMVAAANQDEDETSAIGPARLLTYAQTQGYGEQLCEANHWDSSVLSTIRAHPLFEDGRSADQDFTRYQTAEVAALFPEEWLRTTSALGSAEYCARRLNDHFAAGVDGILIHGSVANQMADLLDAYDSVRDASRFAANDPWMEPTI